MGAESECHECVRYATSETGVLEHTFNAMVKFGGNEPDLEAAKFMIDSEQSIFRLMCFNQALY